MNLINGWATPEGKMAKRFTVVCAIFFAVMFLLTFFLKNCGGWSESWPVGVWHALGVGIIYVTIGLGAFDLFILLIYPLWRWERGGQESGKRAYEVAVTTSGYVLGAMLITFFFTSSTLSMIGDRDESGQVQQFANYNAMGDNEFRYFMVPTTATDIKVNDDRGFIYLEYSISCTVNMSDFVSFANANGYRFEHGGRVPSFEKNCVTEELVIDEANNANYYHCLVNGGEGALTGRFGTLQLVYDVANKRLYGSYCDR